MVLRASEPKKNKEEVCSIKEVYWDEVRGDVTRLNPELAKICDEISPDKKYSLLRIRYPYGSTIVDKGVFHLPYMGNLVPITHVDIPVRIKEKLSYSAIPFSLVLHNNIEVFVESGERIIPLNFFKSGDVFGVFESMDLLANIQSNPIWSVSAGGRSVFMLPRITDKVGHNRLRKEFGISCNEPPPDLQGHWKLFKEIYECFSDSKDWYNEVLVFTNKWFKHSNDAKWLKFQLYVCKLCWSQSRLSRDAVELGLLWSSFGNEMSGRNLRPRPYLVETLKQLLSIANGVAVSFKPAVDETTLPVARIQDAYLNCYNLKTYIPTIMQPCKLQADVTKAYYSLALPTVLESTPFVRNAPSIIEDQRGIKRLLDTLIRTIKLDNSVMNPVQHVKYDFFHSDVDQYGDIGSSKLLAQEDKAFLALLVQSFKGRAFCSTAPFFKGCIRITITSTQGEPL
jgi:hypothetical protein